MANAGNQTMNNRKMPFPVVKEGPCGCNLRPVSLFIAWFNLTILVITAATVLAVGVDTTEYFANQPEKTAKLAKQISEIIVYVVFGILITLIGFNVMLLIGIYKENTCHIFAYICMKGSFLVLAYLGAIQQLLSGRLNQNSLMSVLFTVLDSYMLFLLYSYYRQLKEFTNGRIYDNRSGLKA